MAETLTNIQTDARFWANDSLLDITSNADNLRIFNMIYQGFANPEFYLFGVKLGRRWPEFTQEDTSLTMVVSQEQYDWPTSPVFIQPIWVEGLDVNDSNEPYPVNWAPDMLIWSAFDDTSDDTPLYCRLINVSGTIKLAFRPTPIRADGIRITGLTEVTELTAGGESTVFINNSADKALGMCVAAMFKQKRGEMGEAQKLVNMAAALLPINDPTPVLTGGGKVLPWIYGDHLSWRSR